MCLNSLTKHTLFRACTTRIPSSLAKSRKNMVSVETSVQIFSDPSETDESVMLDITDAALFVFSVNVQRWSKDRRPKGSLPKNSFRVAV